MYRMNYIPYASVGVKTFACIVASAVLRSGDTMDIV